MRKTVDNLLKALLWICGGIAVAFLALILIYVITRGIPYINWDFLTTAYRPGLDQHGIRGCFDAFVFGPDLPKGRGKPAPDIFLIACQKLGTTPARALVLEDSEAGIQAAHSARIPVLCVPDPHHPAPAYESMTAAFLSSLHEVPVWLEAQNAQ